MESRLQYSYAVNSGHHYFASYRRLEVGSPLGGDGDEWRMSPMFRLSRNIAATCANVGTINVLDHHSAAASNFIEKPGQRIEIPPEPEHHLAPLRSFAKGFGRNA